MPPYFHYLDTQKVGNGTVADIATRAFANLLTAAGKKKDVCIVVSDLAAAYDTGGKLINKALAGAPAELGRQERKITGRVHPSARPGAQRLRDALPGDHRPGQGPLGALLAGAVAAGHRGQAVGSMVTMDSEMSQAIEKGKAAQSIAWIRERTLVARGPASPNGSVRSTLTYGHLA